MRWLHYSTLRFGYNTFTSIGLRILQTYIPKVQIACHDHWKQQYLANKSTFSTTPRKRTLLETFLYKPTIGQIKDEFDTYINQPISEMISYPIDLFRWHFDHKEVFPTLGARHSFYTCNVGGVRASLFQCEEAAYPSPEQPAGGHH